MGLICRLRGHRADRIGARWNGETCFGRCARCGCDLVRTADRPWRAPRGYRIVWQAGPRAHDYSPRSPPLPDGPGLASATRDQAARPPVAVERTEWPLPVRNSRPRPGSVAAPAASSAPTVDNRGSTGSQTGGADFMDDHGDALDWPDFATASSRSGRG